MVPYKSDPAAMTDLISGQVMAYTADFAANGFSFESGVPDDLARLNKAETVKWEKAIREARIEQQ
jgi:hypothetical protein